VKILHIIDTLNVGGAERVCLNLITMLHDSGHQADCMVISSKGKLYDQIDKRAKVFFLDRSRKFNLIKMLKCASFASDYDIVHVHMRHTWVYTKLALLLSHKHQKLVFHDHYGDISLDQNVPYRLKWPFRPDHYIAVSDDLKGWARMRFEKKGTRIYKLQNTIILSHIRSDKYSGDWILVSNLRSTKNLLFAIKLAYSMQRSLVIFGNHDGSHYADRVIMEAQGSGNVKIVQNEANVQQYLGNFTLAIHTSVSETGPLVLLEYMANGLPFISSPTGDVVSQIKDVFPTLIADSFEIEEWVQKISALEYMIKSDGKELSSVLKKLFAEKFSQERYIEQCLKIYQNVLTC